MSEVTTSEALACFRSLSCLGLAPCERLRLQSPTFGSRDSPPAAGPTGRLHAASWHLAREKSLVPEFSQSGKSPEISKSAFKTGICKSLWAMSSLREYVRYAR